MWDTFCGLFSTKNKDVKSYIEELKNILQHFKGVIDGTASPPGHSIYKYELEQRNKITAIVEKIDTFKKDKSINSDKLSSEISDISRIFDNLINLSTEDSTHKNSLIEPEQTIKFLQNTKEILNSVVKPYEPPQQKM